MPLTAVNTELAFFAMQARTGSELADGYLMAADCLLLCHIDSRLQPCLALLIFYLCIRNDLCLYRPNSNPKEGPRSPAK